MAVWKLPFIFIQKLLQVLLVLNLVGAQSFLCLPTCPCPTIEDTSSRSLATASWPTSLHAAQLGHFVNPAICFIMFYLLSVIVICV
jgi:hypothetical protein